MDNTQSVLTMSDLIGPHFQFYVPRCTGFEELPGNDHEVWPWICAVPGRPSGRTVWTVYTCLVLRKVGVNCSIVRDFPTEGIVVSHRDFLPAAMAPRADVYLVCIKPDRKHHSWAQAHVTQNANDPLKQRSSRDFVSHIPYWPQPSLIPRNTARGTLIENIAYVGRSLNQDPYLRRPEWRFELGKRGFRWSKISTRNWHDYSAIDVTVSVRRFGNAHVVATPTMSSDSKPPSKLTNSWLAGVPAIVGDESSFRAVRKSDLDFIVATSKTAIMEALDRLSRNPSLYADMVENGRRRSAEFSTDAVSLIWKQLLDEHIANQYQEFLNESMVHRTLQGWLRYFKYWIDFENIKSAVRGLGGS